MAPLLCATSMAYGMKSKELPNLLWLEWMKHVFLHLKLGLKGMGGLPEPVWVQIT